MFERLDTLQHELDALISSATLARDVKLQSDVYDFVNEVGEQVSKAFTDVHQVLGEIAFIKPSELNEDKVRALQSKLSNTYARDKFKTVHKICERLGALADHYRTHIEPLLSREGISPSSQLFLLLEKHEGAFIYTIRKAVDEIIEILNDYRLGSDIEKARARAQLGQQELRACLDNVRRTETKTQISLPGGPRKLLGIERVADDVLRKNAWFSGGFYLATALLLLGALTIVAGNVNPWIFPILVTSAFAGLTVIGAFQLRNDNRLSEQRFFRLVDLSLRRVLLPLTRTKNS